MRRDRLFAPRRRPSGAGRWLLLLLLLCAPAFALLRSRTGPGAPAVGTEAVTEVTIAATPVAAPPPVSAQSAILMDAATGTVLYQRDARARRPMASTTKIMTALLVIEHGGLNNAVTASEHAANTPYTGLYLRKGEQVRVEDLLWAILLRSANDACVAAAEHVAGSEEAFIAMMNARARALGMNDTHFMNPHGLHHPDHYSSAYDLAILTRHALGDPRFAEMVARKRRRIDRSVEKQDVVVVNKNRLLFRWDLADGVKTGYTRQAGHCLVASASQADWRLIAVVLKSSDSWSDSRALLEHGFRAYQEVVVAKRDAPVVAVPVVGGMRPTLRAVAAEPLSVLAPRGARVDLRTRTQAGKVRAPLTRGATVGTLVVRRGDTEVGRTLLLAASGMDERPQAPLPGWAVSGVAALLTFFSLRTVARYGRKAAQGPRRRRRRFSP